MHNRAKPPPAKKANRPKSGLLNETQKEKRALNSSARHSLTVSLFCPAGNGAIEGDRDLS